MLIDHVVENALKTKIFNKIIITTDNKNYLKKNNFKTNKKIIFDYRNSNLSSGNATIIEVIKYTINKFKFFEDNICCTFPTSIFLEKKHYKKAFEKLKKKEKLIIVPIKKYEHPINRAIKVLNNFKAKILINKNANKRTQDSNRYFYDAGQFYLANARVWLKNTKILNNNFCPLKLNILDSQFLIDVDEIEDLSLLKFLHKIKS